MSDLVNFRTGKSIKSKPIKSIQRFRSQKVLFKYLLKKYPDVVKLEHGFVDDDFIKSSYTLRLQRDSEKIVRRPIIVKVNKSHIVDSIGRIYTNHTIVSINEYL